MAISCTEFTIRLVSGSSGKLEVGRVRNKGAVCQGLESPDQQRSSRQFTALKDSRLGNEAGEFLMSASR